MDDDLRSKREVAFQLRQQERRKTGHAPESEPPVRVGRRVRWVERTFEITRVDGDSFWVKCVDTGEAGGPFSCKRQLEEIENGICSWA